MIEIKRLTIDDSDTIIDLVGALLIELRDDWDGYKQPERNKILAEWKRHNDRFTVFAAYDGTTPVGILTLAENFALYANGSYGIINELYIVPDHRSAGVGKMLIEAAKSYGRERRWKRIDVTAPPGEEWQRTVGFYEREGFVFTGPKLRLLIG
jgi:GNAT superfamily N-acetyltransferase